MRWGQFRLRSAVHLISRLRRQLPLIGEAVGVRKSKASPSRGGGTAIAVTERSYQICGNLSVTFGDSSPGRGAFPRKKVTPIKILVALSIDGNRSKATSCKPDTPVSGGAYYDAVGWVSSGTTSKT